MKTFKISYILAATAIFGLSACNKFLDTTPDNRATVDSEEKVISLVGSAYSENDHILIAEFYSDNVDNYGVQYTGTSRFFDSIYQWSELQESNNESTERIWGSYYSAIAAANQAIIAIDELGGPERSTAISQALGEAYL